MTAEEFIAQWHDDSPQVEVQTSGSTGKPKRMLVDKGRMAASAVNTCRFLRLERGERGLLCMPADYIAGKMMIVRSIVWGLQLDCVTPSSHPLASVDDASYGLAAMVPMQVGNSLKTDGERSKLMQIKNLIIGGGMLDESLERQLQDLPNKIWASYGMTETLSHIALRQVNGPSRSEWYTPFDNVEVRLDSDGCIVIDAPDVCPTTLATNDIGMMAQDGRRFRILGRKDNVICSGGLKLQIEEIERLLANHLDFPFMITKAPHPLLGEQAVMLMEGSDEAEAESICRSTLQKYMAPRKYINVKRLPLTATGKPARAEAQKLASELINKK